MLIRDLHPPQNLVRAWPYPEVGPPPPRPEIQPKPSKPPHGNLANVDVFDVLTAQWQPLTALAMKLGVSWPTVKHRLDVLVKTGLVEEATRPHRFRGRGHRRVYRRVS